MKDALLILSGGIDSVTMLYDFCDNIAMALNFSYGANHNSRESEMACWHSRKLGVELIEIDLAFMGRYFQSSLLEGGDAIPGGHYEDDNMKSTVVPFRNGVMLSIAAGIAESRGLRAVMIANHGGDHAIYPDCRGAFIDAMSRATELGTYAGIVVRAPYTNLDKTQIVSRGIQLGIDYSMTYSCYRGGEHHCGTCGTCTERREAFIKAGAPDPTVYDNQS